MSHFFKYSAGALWPTKKIKMNQIQSLLTIANQHGSNLQLLAKKLFQYYSNPLEESIFFDNANLTRIMVANGCSVHDANGITGCTALHRSVTLNYADNVKMLLELGADVNAVNIVGQIPLEFFVKFHDRNITKSCQKPNILRLLLQHGTLLVHEDGPMLIRDLLTSGSQEIVKVLLEFDINMIEKDNTGNNQLHYLASNTNPGIAQELHGKDLDVNLTNNLGLTSLDIALRKKVPQVEIVKFLLDKGAEIYNSYQGTSCLTETFVWYMNHILPTIRPTAHEMTYRIVFSNESMKCVEMLIEHGADLQSTLEDEKTKTILYRALCNNKYHFVKFIIGLLAKQEAYGQPISEVLQQQIESNGRLKKYMDVARQLVFKIKKSEIR